MCWTRSSSDSRDMKRKTRKTRIKEVSQVHQVIIVLSQEQKKRENIMRERGILTYKEGSVLRERVICYC